MIFEDAVYFRFGVFDNSFRPHFMFSAEFFFKRVRKWTMTYIV